MSAEIKNMRDYAFEFRGAPGEYFKIWLVNILLTVLTLGVFSAWATTRRKRYFYGNTFLGHAAFSYHASPLAILLARAVLLALVLGGSWWAGDDAIRGAGASLLLLALLPWALVRGLAFNARNSSYCNVRFGFDKSPAAYLTMYGVYAPLFVLAALQLLIVLGDVEVVFEGVPAFIRAAAAGGFFIWLFLPFVAPWFFRAYHAAKASLHFWGRSAFAYKKPAAAAYLTAMWGAPLAAFAVFAAWAIGWLIPLGLNKTYAQEYTLIYTAVLFVGAMILLLTRARIFHLLMLLACFGAMFGLTFFVFTHKLPQMLQDGSELAAAIVIIVGAVLSFALFLTLAFLRLVHLMLFFAWLGLATFLAAALAGYLMEQRLEFESAEWGVVFILVIFLSLSFILMRALLFKLYWQSIVLPGGGRLRCKFNIVSFGFKILLMNLLASVLSFGLLIPWAAVRKARFLAAHITAVMPPQFEAAAAAQQKSGAFGEELSMSEGFDFDVGLI